MSEILTHVCNNNSRTIIFCNNNFKSSFENVKSLSRLNELWINAKSSISRLELLVQHVLFLLEFRINLENEFVAKKLFIQNTHVFLTSLAHTLYNHMLLIDP